MAHTLFRAKVHIGYLAAIVAASNAGGSGSVVGDTTTTMMWIDGMSPLDVFHAYAGAGVAILVCGIPAAIQQQRYSPILKHEHEYVHVDLPRVGIVVFILATAIAVNIIINVRFPELSNSFPFIGASVACAVLVSAVVRRPTGNCAGGDQGQYFFVIAGAVRDTYACRNVTGASWQTAFGLGFVSAVFDNIPLTALALKQGR